MSWKERLNRYVILTGWVAGIVAMLFGSLDAGAMCFAIAAGWAAGIEIGKLMYS